MADQPTTFRSFVAAFTDFLTVAVHTILYERGIYPATSFLTAKKYHYAVRQNRHPSVCEWINDAITAVSNELLKGVVERICVVMYSSGNEALEKFVFDVSRFPNVPTSDLDTPLERRSESGGKAAVLPTVDLEEQFRATMSKLSNCSSVLKPLPEKCTFTIAVELKDEGQAPIAHPQPWIPVQPRPDSSSDRGAREETQEGQRITPVRSVKAGDMRFESWIEEGQAKFAGHQSQTDSSGG